MNQDEGEGGKKFFASKLSFDVSLPPTFCVKYRQKLQE